MRIAAADPGQTGAIALLVVNDTGIHLEAVHDMATTMEVLSTGKTRRRVCPTGTAAILKALAPDLLVIEQVGARPGQGVTGVYDFGRSSGILEGLAAGLGIEVRRVHPQTWIAHHGLTGTGKAGALALATSTFPAMAHLFSRKKDSGRADAAMLGLYGAGTMVPA